MIRSVDLTVWVILEVLKIIYACRYVGTVKEKCVRMQGRSGSGAPVRRHRRIAVAEVCRQSIGYSAYGRRLSVQYSAYGHR